MTSFSYSFLPFWDTSVVLQLKVELVYGLFQADISPLRSVVSEGKGVRAAFIFDFFLFFF